MQTRLMTDSLHRDSEQTNDIGHLNSDFCKNHKSKALLLLPLPGLLEHPELVNQEIENGQ